MNILGISAYYHDSAACLVRDGEIIAAAQEERFTRKKHDHRFPTHAVNYCLRQGGVSPEKLDFIAFYDKPLQKFERLLETYLDYSPRGIQSFLKAMPLWLREKLWTRDQLTKSCNSDATVLFTEHHESHAASAFFPSPFQSAAILTIDGVGEWATSSYGRGVNNEIHLFAETKFPHSLGLLYSAFTYYTGFRVNSGEYKVMGLAPYGEPKYVQTILNELVDIAEDGSVHLNMKYFNYAHGLTMTNRAFDALFGGPPRDPESQLSQREMDLARSIQEVTELAMLRMARHVHRETGETALCLAGGVALNCVGNGRILREGPFEHIWIQPAAGDAGGALGAALSVWFQYLGNDRSADALRGRQSDAMKGSYLGPQFDDVEIEAYLQSVGAKWQRLTRRCMIHEVAKRLASEKVVGWFQGRMEFGPRALGARSILGDPRSPRMQSVMNLKIKFRESFRPFAPSILSNRAHEYFDIGCESPYMLLVAPVQAEIKREMDEAEDRLFGIAKLNVPRSTIPAVTHVDYSARVQTVQHADNPIYHELLSEFDRLTGCPVLVNTSFNVRGEPIVCTPEDAYRCFMRTGIDALVLGEYLLDKSDQPASQEGDSWKQEFQLD
jgi:carbamoyltransferase